MTVYSPLRQVPGPAGYRTGDILVLCGELFGRGYANGIVDEARTHGMTIIGTTIGRRGTDGALRPLTPEELAEAESSLGGKIINIPLEAGFDMEPAADGRSPLDQLKGMKVDDWQNVSLDWDAVEVSRRRGRERFRSAMGAVTEELTKSIQPGANVLFVHAMAGGMPRARLFMPVFNRVFKGQGERYLSSETFWDSEMGNLCRMNFDEVTADTFLHLIEMTEPFRERQKDAGGTVRYVAYGYHGCEVLIEGAYRWQSYTPYLPGWAKIGLENHAIAARQQGIAATVYNCPEILTNSSALFLGVELSLYPFLAAIEREGGAEAARPLRQRCRELLKDGVTVDHVLAAADQYLSLPVLAPFGDFGSWPRHNTPDQAEAMLAASANLLAMNADPKEIVCAELSKAIFLGVGKLMYDGSWNLAEPVFWLNHDVIARRLAAG